MAKAFISIHHRPEEYDVKVYVYSDDGKLYREKVYEKIKQVVIKNPREVRISAQLASNPTVLIVSIDRVSVNVRDNILYIGE